MKKYFIFAAIAAAGLFASCSSSDDAISENNVPISNESDDVAIKIGVSSPKASITRGTGTVGGVVDGTNAVNNDGSTTGTPAANVWAGQKVNVYMFDQGTLDLATFNGAVIYENAELTTPKDAESGIAKYLVPNNATFPAGTETIPAQTGVNTPTQEQYVKYYPLSGKYDFWGYRIDDAANAAAPAVSEGKLSTTFDVDGTQDILGATTPATMKAWADMSNTEKAVYDNTEATYTAAVAARYSASAARKGLQPELIFKHMMTRLTFEAYAGHDAAKKDDDGAGTNYAGVYVTGIKVRAIRDIVAADDTTYISPVGATFDIAGTGTFTQTLTFADIENVSATTQATKPAAFELKARPYAYLTATPATIINKVQFDKLSVADQALYTPYATPAAEKLIPLVNANDDDPATNGSVWLVGTNCTDPANPVCNPIGEAIIAPAAKVYEIEIQLCQNVPITVSAEDGTVIRRDNIETYTKKVVTRLDDTKSFEVGNSYNFRIKVYGLQDIAITTTLNPWAFGENIGIDTDN